MGKIHDALEKSGKARELSVVPAAKYDHSIAGTSKAPAATQMGKTISEPVRKESKSVRKRVESPSPQVSLDPNLITYHDPHSVEAEIFKILRTNILFPKAGHPAKSIMVTSAIPGDGKSFVAANLAISIAQGIEEHVLLMDCDMRRSSIHTSFGFDAGVPGLSDYLSGGRRLDSLLKKTVVEKLTILPGGPMPPNPSELISSQAMKDLLKEAKNRYADRYIIVDSPPPQLTAETTALAKHIDGIILVVKYG